MIFTYSINERYGNWSDMVSRENDCQKLQRNQLFCKIIVFFGQRSKYLGMTKTFGTPTPLFRYCRPLFHNSNLWFFGLIGCGGGFAFERRLLCSWSLALWWRDLQGISFFYWLQHVTERRCSQGISWVNHQLINNSFLWAHSFTDL